MRPSQLAESSWRRRSRRGSSRLERWGSQNDHVLRWPLDAQRHDSVRD
jgi:hypothetical protein